MRWFCLVLLMACSGAFAQADDKWTSPDKVLHFGAAAGISGICVATGGEVFQCFLTGAVVNLAKEWYDKNHPATHSFSKKDLVMGIAGAYFGARLTRDIQIQLGRKEVQVSLRKEF